MQIDFLIQKTLFQIRTAKSLSFCAICKLQLFDKWPFQVGRFAKTMMNQGPLCSFCNQSEKHQSFHSYLETKVVR